MKYTFVPIKEGMSKKVDRIFKRKEHLFHYLNTEKEQKDCIVFCDYGTAKYPQPTPIASVNTVDGVRWVVLE